MIYNKFLCASSIRLFAGLLENSLDNLLLLNKEGSDNSVLDTVGAQRSAVSSLDGLGGLGNSGKLSGSEGGDSGESNTALTALGSTGGLLDVQVSEVATGSLDDLDSVGSGVVWG